MSPRRQRQEITAGTHNEFAYHANECLEYNIDKGIYRNTTLITADGDRHPVDRVYLWAKYFDGTSNVDIDKGIISSEEQHYAF